MEKSKKAYHEKVAENLIAQLKQGTAPWQKPWQPGDPLLSFPNNPTTAKRYRGINALYLMSQGRADSRWLTYKQAESLNAQVRKGEKSTLIQYWKFTDERIKKKENGSPVLDSAGKPVKEQVKLERPRVFYATVFNAEQIDNLPELIIDPPQWNPIEKAEQILQASNAVIQHGEHDRAFYRPATDSIHLPHKHQFETPGHYYATALHELGHWSGHESRLNRDLSHPFGSEGYAREELRAEIASMLLGHELGLGHDPGQHVAYVASWIKALEEDPTEIFRAAADAEKIQDYVLAFAQQQEIVEQEAIKMEQIKQEIATYTAGLAPDVATIVQQNNRQIEKRMEGFSVKNRDAVYLVADALKFYRNFSIDNLEFEQVAQDKLGFKIPADWDGGVQIQACAIETDANGNGHVKPPKDSGVDQEFWRVYVQIKNQTWIRVEDFENELHAQDAAQKLFLIDVVAEPNEQEKSKKLTQIHEPRVDNDLIAEVRRHAMESKEEDTNQRAEKVIVRQYLAVPYSEKDQAKVAGARWDKAAKAWYVGEDADILALQRWFPENVCNQQEPAILPEVEFADLLRSNGCIVDGNHPIMDGKKQRIRMEDDKPGQKSGFYVAHLDNHPAGYFINNRTQSETRWRAKGYTLTDEQKAAFAAHVAAQQQIRQAELHAQQVKVADAIRELLAVAPAATADHPYLQEKQARPGSLKMVPQNIDDLFNNSIIKICNEGREIKAVREQFPDSLIFVAGDLLLPVYDINGQIWSVQTIQAGGAKFFAAGSQKEGHFHVVDEKNQGLAALECAQAIVIAEGYATADTASSALDCPVVAAFDSGNLISIAKLLNDQYPHKPIIIAGDDDQHLVKLNKTNTGREKAIEAAELVGGVAVFPIFAPGEQESQKLSDFNDLATKSTLGIDAVKRQVGMVAEKVINQNKVEKLQASLPQHRVERAQKQTVAR